MNRPPDRGRGRGNPSRGRGKSRVTQADVEAYLKAHKLQFPSLQDAASASASSSPLLTEVVQNDEVFKLSEHTEIIMILEFQDEQYDPWELKSRYMDTLSYPVPEGKYRYIYEAMLQETGSVEFRHTYDSKLDQKSPISYSRAIIRKVITIQKWGIHPQKSKTLSIKGENGIPIHFNYWDYIDAWTKAFYYQNQKRRHSWFFKLCPFLEGKDVLPNWFLDWWSKFGPKSDFLIHEVQKELEFFNQHHPQLQGTDTTQGKSFLFTMITFGIPWIWKWDLEVGRNNLGLPVLKRTFQYRWWKTIDLEKTFIQIKNSTQELKAQFKKDRTTVKNPFLEHSALIRTKYPDLSDNEIVIKTMDYMKEQFLQTVQPSQNIADDVSMTSAKSNEDNNNPFSCLAGESQDPYEDEGTTPTLGDFWDSMTELMAEQLSSRKGKEKQ